MCILPVGSRFDVISVTILNKVKTALLSLLGILLTSCTSAEIVLETGDVILNKHTIDVPFTVQAPFANWDDPYQEACEEASLLTVHAYLAGEELTPETADRQILDLVSWEKDHEYPQDVTLKELAEIAENYYGYESEIIDDPSLSDIQQQIAKGNPIIVPAAGRMLGNPYFSGEGPWYHMLVITGYDSRRFITNDPGTRRGEDYKYKHQVLLDAIHDWTGIKEEIETGSRRALILHRNIDT